MGEYVKNKKAMKSAAALGMAVVPIAMPAAAVVAAPPNVFSALRVAQRVAAASAVSGISVCLIKALKTLKARRGEECHG